MTSHSVQELADKVRRGIQASPSGAAGHQALRDAFAALRSLEEQLEAQRELIEEAHRFALVLAELKVRTRPFAEAWLDKYRALYPASRREDA